MFDILIVEDELIAAEYLKEILTANGFNVIKIIDNGKEAINEIPKLKPDIVLMDIMLKDNISGSEVALYLKQYAPDVAIIFLTAYTNDEMVDYAINSNSFGYLMKPYNEKEIINTLKVVLARLKNKNTTNKKISNIIKLSSELSFDLKQKKLLKNNIEFSVSKHTLSFLEILSKNINSCISNEQISMHIWGEIKNNITIRTQVHRIKTKLGENIIINVNGIGYKIQNYI